MSVAELPDPRSSGDLSASNLMRTPPQDLAAEQSVLGGMLLSKDAIADVVEVVRGHDFYRPAHELVYDAILDLYGRGEPADAVTVSAELQKRGELGRVGGAPYLHTLLQSVPTAANAGYYARIVRETAILRRLIEAGTKIVQLGYSGDGDADDIVDAAQAEVYAVTDKRTSEDYQPLSAIMEAALDEIEAIGSRGGEMVGVPTGFADFDELTNGLHPGQMIVVAARPAVGKALALDTPLPTPTGWTTMGQVAVGDQLLGADGRPTTVVAATDVMTGRPCFEVEFSDGTVLVADAEHGWLTHSARDDGGPNVRTTRELAVTLWTDRADAPTFAHSVDNTAPLELPDRPLPLAPYAAGALWAQQVRGGADLDPEIGMYVAAGVDQSVDVTAVLGGQGGAATLPPSYLRASEQQRRAVLAGLLDQLAGVSRSGCVLATGLPVAVAEFVRELVVGLGYECFLTVGESGAVDVAACIGDQVFRLHRKHVEHKQRLATRPAMARSRAVVDVRPVRSVPVRCVEVDNADHLYLAGRAMVPTHNSTLGLDIARSAAIKHNLATCIFSLEMGRTEITMRLLSAEARVSLHSMRTGKLTDDDWTKLARRMGEVSNAPLFIDDSPNMSMMEIRAKCRRLKQRHDLKLVVIDYLQLMQSGKRVESRQQEVSEFSRALKLLAKELDVPVIAISQLNRGPEQRTDKKPQMSDLRESGCLTADTRVMRADTGAEVTLGELYETGARDIPVWSLNERLQFEARPMTHVFSSGVKETFRVRLASGREVTATANHPFLTYDGWKALADLEPGSRVAIARHTPPPLHIEPHDEDEIVLLAHLIGDGSFVRRRPIRYASVDEANLRAVTEAALRRFGITAVRDDYAAARVTTLRLPAPFHLTYSKRNPIAAWLDEMNLFGLRSHEKFVPSWVFSLPKAQVALFLRHLWATDGCVHWYDKYGWARIYYASTSRRLVDDVARLLLRFNIAARVRVSARAGHRPCYQLLITGSEPQMRFLSEIGVHGHRQEQAVYVMSRLDSIVPKSNVDTVPPEVWQRVRTAMEDMELTPAAVTRLGGGGITARHSVTRGRLARLATALGSAELQLLATNDVLWDRVISIEPLGEQTVFDATVLGSHNFVANGIALHNSIEQDADMVVLLHREELYERESPRAGEADFIVAKHRNGPTATITVAFQGHYSRFVDMAHS